MKRQNFSKKRELIYNKICSTNIHPSAEWVYNNLKEEYPDLSLGTVYRNLALFKKQGTIISVANVNGQERFDGKTKPHSHFICTECGAVIDIEDESGGNPLDNALSEKYGFTVTHHNLIFYGTCDKCNNRKLS